jgi:hypothetical protein
MEDLNCKSVRPQVEDVGCEYQTEEEARDEYNHHSRREALLAVDALKIVMRGADREGTIGARNSPRTDLLLIAANSEAKVVLASDSR